MGTYTEVFALACSPERSRKPTARAMVANYGVGRPRKSEYDRARPNEVLGRVLMGFSDEREAPWITFDPDGVVAIRRDVLRAIARTDESSDEEEGWFGDQLRRLDGVLAHAERNHEWVVSVFEGNVPCFLRGGALDRRLGDPIFEPHCTITTPPRTELPLGIALIVLPPLALLAWRMRRLRA